MNPQKDNMITRQVQESDMVVEDNQWTLESPTTTSKMGSLSTSTAKSTDIWQKNVDWKRKNVKQGHVSNVRRKDISPRTAKESRQ